MTVSVSEHSMLFVISKTPTNRLISFCLLSGNYWVIRCGHCTRLKPTWSQLAEMLNTQDESRVRIAKVDCTENQKTCSGNEVTSYPTLKFFKLNSEEEPVKYRSTRDLPSLTQFINDQLGSSTPEEEESDETIVVPAPLKGLIELTDKNFATQTATGNWFIKFYGKAAFIVQF